MYKKNPALLNAYAVSHTLSGQLSIHTYPPLCQFTPASVSLEIAIRRLVASLALDVFNR